MRTQLLLVEIERKDILRSRAHAQNHPLARTCAHAVLSAHACTHPRPHAHTYMHT